jgi:hypothetical protein
MDRDLKFEVQYLLSLTLVIFGLLSVDSVSESIEVWIGISVVILLSIYFSIFTVLYGLHQSTPIKIDFIDRMNRHGKTVLMIISVGFAYFIGHTISAIVYENVLAGLDFTTERWQTIINLGVPLLPIGIMSGVYRNYVAGPSSKYTDVNVKVIPDSIRVFPSRDDTRPLTIKVENDSNEDVSFTLTIDVPENVAIHSDVQTFTNEFADSDVISSGRAYRKNFQLSHSSDTRLSDLIEINVDFEDASHKKEVELQLEK